MVYIGVYSSLKKIRFALERGGVGPDLTIANQGGGSKIRIFCKSNL